MSLTGIPLILLAAVATAGALGATVLLWRRFGRWRYVVRPAGVLLVEALLTLTVGLLANRSQDFYPTWAALFATGETSTPSYHTRAGRLDTWLTTQPNAGYTQSFAWAPPGYELWHLAAAPTVVVPAGYLQHPSLRYSAVLVLASKADDWPTPSVTGPTILIEAVTTSETKTDTLATTIPAALERDLRVTEHRWAMVTSADDNELARQVATSAQGLYPAIGFVGVAAPHTTPVAPPTPPVKTTTKPPVATKPPAKGKTAVKSKTPVKPKPTIEPVPTTVVLPPGSLPAGILANYFPPAPKTPAEVVASLKAAVAWAAAQTPPPLAASAPEPSSLPIPTKSSSAAPTGKRAAKPGARRQTPVRPQESPSPLGGPDGAGQPRP